MEGNKEYNQRYLGDGVYAQFDGWGIKLLVNDLEEPTDTVYIEPSVLEALVDFFNDCTK